MAQSSYNISVVLRRTGLGKKKSVKMKQVRREIILINRIKLKNCYVTKT
jgi:hypothetical protein